VTSWLLIISIWGERHPPLLRSFDHTHTHTHTQKSSFLRSTLSDYTGWRRVIGCLILIGHFPQKSPIISGSLAKMTCNLRHAMCLGHPVAMNVSEKWYSRLSHSSVVDWVTLLYPKDTVDYYWVNLMYTNDTVHWQASWERVFYPVYTLSFDLYH